MTAAASRKRASDAAYAPPVQAAIVVAGVVALWGASLVSIPLGPVPVTLQTFAVFTLAGIFGGRLGLAIVLAWLTLAALGAPVLANGAGGWKAVTGHTAGFLVGMAAAAWVCGEGARRAGGWLPLTFLFLGGHVIVLAVGWAGLASFMSPGPAFEGGILPLLPGAALKSLAAALTVRLVSR